ncbi:hypothetical protein [Listeria grayi]|uniref:hypothetical protein n=1 Tax=Listeria grayi TaxID=1641 RepID=UPI001624EECC|nr:hypothetical protein [Listeria grayi]MBC1921845.1 hypothetical protein [Listeria grayi]
MININCAMKRDFITDLLENYQGNGISFKKVAEQGMKMTFESNLESEEAAKVAKELIKSTEIGAVLYFQVSVVGS